MIFAMNDRNRNTKLLCLITAEKQLPMFTLIFWWSLIDEIPQLKTIRLKEAKAKDREENFITVFFEI